MREIAIVTLSAIKHLPGGKTFDESFLHVLTEQVKCLNNHFSMKNARVQQLVKLSSFPCPFL